MGYTSLSKALDSDNAADVVGDIVSNIIKRLSEELEQESYEYDTDGVVSVALILEGFSKSHNLFSFDNDFYLFIDKVIKKLYNLIQEEENSNIDDWDGDYKNKQYHLNAYKRMYKNLKKFQEKLT